MRRELAWRVFAGEYNDSTLEIKGVGEKTPSHIITPLGSKVNRLFVVGVLTDVENVSEGGEFVRAHISDPTGVFTLYSGQFQQNATDQLLSIDAPAFVAVVGKIVQAVKGQHIRSVHQQARVLAQIEFHELNRL